MVTAQRPPMESAKMQPSAAGGPQVHPGQAPGLDGLGQEGPFADGSGTRRESLRNHNLSVRCQPVFRKVLMEEDLPAMLLERVMPKGRHH